MTLALAATLLGLGLCGAFVAGLLGLGGAIVMIPLLLYVPPFLGVGRLTMKAVAGITMVQVFVAALSGMLAHRRHKAVNRDVALVGGVAMAAGSFTGALGSKYVHEWWLLLVFAVMVTAAGLVLLLPRDDPPGGLEPACYSRPRTAGVAGGVGVAAGLVGAGGAFLLVPLLLVVVKVPIRITVGSSLAITTLSSVGGLAGKLLGGQVPLESAALVALGAVPGAQLGAVVSRRLSGRQLKLVLGAVIAAIALRLWIDLVAR